MSTSQETSPVVLLFPFCYLAALYAAVHFGDRMLDMSYEASWERMPDAAGKLKALLYIYPAVSIPLSIAVLAAMQQSAKAGGRGALFLIGAAACAAGNLMSFQGLKMLVGWKTVSEWSALLNTQKLNLLTSVIAPVAAFVVAYLIVFGVFRLKAWLKPE
jgi:low temperature requirement protein LtrA